MGMTYDGLLRAIAAAVSPLPQAPVSASPAPQVTVSMPAYNAAPYIADAIKSVLHQTGVELELIVVDDASEDGTAAVVESIGDPRLTLLRNDRRRGIGHGHNRVLQHSRAPVIVHVDADDLILPGALAKALAAIESAPDVGQAYANHFDLDQSGHITVQEFELRRAFLTRVRASTVDFRRDLLVHGMITNPLRTYRKSALIDVGSFNETVPSAEDWEMSVRIADRYDLRLINEFLYCQRVHGSNTQRNATGRALRSWRNRYRITRALLKRKGGRLLGRSRAEVHALMLLGLVHALELPTVAKRVVRGPRRLLQSRRNTRSSTAS
jgi:glycosyltransferase involved in cell wall biosynthesis